MWTYLQSIHYTAITRQLRTQLRSNKISVFMLPLKNSCEQQRTQWAVTAQTYCCCWGNCSLGFGKWNGARNPAVPKGSWDFSYAQTLLWFVQYIINPVHAALRRSLHSGRNRYSVLGKTTLEEISRTSKEVEVNKAFFMSASDPHSCNLATITRKWTSSALL